MTTGTASDGNKEAQVREQKTKEVLCMAKNMARSQTGG